MQVLKERRFKNLWVSTELFSLIIFGWSDSEYIRLPVLKEKNDKMFLVNTSYSEDKGCFVLTIGSLDFEPVVLGDLIPSFDPEYHVIQVPKNPEIWDGELRV